uniref:DUF2946 domain-containing protein n=1 Tax=Pseudomonas sp. RIT-PI-S TaxID=3035295 RepID=UPI0021DB285A
MRIRPGSPAGAWISLFAMLMMFIGPLVSQAMPMDHGRMASPHSMNMTMDTPGAHCQPQAQSSHDKQLHPMWERCGYCSLFFHCPALPQSLQWRADTAP